MNWLKISWKNIWYKPLSSILSILLLAFGAGIISLLLNVSEQLEKQFTKNIAGIDMVIGAKGSPLQLLLSSVYQIDAPTGNIDLKEYKKLLKNPLVKTGIPLAFGDNFEGYRMVGTESSYLDLYNGEIKEGQLWSQSGEAVIGARVQELTELELHKSFSSSHGFNAEMGDNHDHFKYQVVGVLKPTGTVLDKLILTNIESVWDVHKHEEHEEHEEHEGHEGHDHKEKPKEITAAFIKFKSPMGIMSIPRYVNQKTSMQAALPAIEINRLFSLMGTGISTLKSLAFLIVLISGISVFISLYQSLKERKFELALLRTMGATRFQLFSLVILEGLVISIIGFLAGMAFSKIAMKIISGMAEEIYQYNLQTTFFSKEEGLLFLGILALGFVASILPSVQAFRLNISKTLGDA